MKVTVTSYIKLEDKIIAQIESGDMNCGMTIPVQEYEDWLTDGTGVIDMGFTHHDGNVLQEVEIKEPIADYWLKGAEINDSPVCEHIQLYLTRNELNRSICIAKLYEEYLIELFHDQLDNSTDAKIRLNECIIRYKDIGEQMAGQMYKKILSSRTS